jgi:recA bacterial DNA recombination protein
MSPLLDLAALSEHPLMQRLTSARAIERREARGQLKSGIAGLDLLLQGGWPRGACSELSGARSSGRTAVVMATLGQALAEGETAALIDVGGGLDAEALRAHPLPSLLWIRCQPEQALAAAALILDAGGFGLAVLDAGDSRLRMGDATALRMKRMTARQNTALLLSSSWRLPGVHGQAAVALSSVRPSFEKRPGRVRGLLTGLQTRADLQRIDGGKRPAHGSTLLSLERR